MRWFGGDGEILDGCVRDEARKRREEKVRSMRGGLEQLGERKERRKRSIDACKLSPSRPIGINHTDCVLV